jgi:hypothetical protein
MHTIFLCTDERKERQFSTTFRLSVTRDCDTFTKRRRHTVFIKWRNVPLVTYHISQEIHILWLWNSKVDQKEHWLIRTKDYFWNLRLSKRLLWRKIIKGHKNRVRVTLLLEVCRQSVRISVKPLETHDQRVFKLHPWDHSPYVTSSMTRRWVCLLWICLAFRHLERVIENSSFCTIEVHCQCRLCKADHAYLTYLMLQRQLSHLNGRKLDHRQV